MGTFALRIHCRLKTCLVNGQVVFAGYIGREIDRKAIGVIQLEDRGAIDDGARHLAHRRGQQRHAGGEGLGEPHLLLCQYPLRMRPTLGQLRIGCAHLRFEHRDQLMKKRLANTQLVPRDGWRGE